MFGFGAKNKVKVSKTKVGMHGDHWDAVFGYDNPEELQGRIMGFVEKLQEVTKVDGMDVMEVPCDAITVRGLIKASNLRTLFPVFSAEKTLPVEVREIIQWAHADKLEAQIVASGRDTFGLNFFATDYAAQKTRYHAGGDLDISLTGICFGVDIAANSPELSDDFCAYMPSSNLPGGMYYDFIGEVQVVSDTVIQDQKLKRLDVKLINDPDDPDMFVLPILVNVAHIRADGVERGTRLSGCFWLQGEITG